jgi:Htaa
MSPYEPSRNRLATGLLALTAATALLACLAAPARALSPVPPIVSGSGVIVPANHEKGRTLSGQGVKLLPGAGANSQDGKLTLPVKGLTFGTQPAAATGATLTFKRGKKSVEFTDVRFDLAAGTLAGKFQGGEVPIFWLGAAPQVDSTAGSVWLKEGKLRLNSGTADTLERELDLKRALVHKNVGMVWLAAFEKKPAAPTPPTPKPSHEAARAVLGGEADWGLLASWRAYILGQQGPPTSIGSITVSDGATTNGTMSEASAFFGFPATGGSFEKGLNGAQDKLALETEGTVKFAKPFHCIVEVSVADLRVTLDGANSKIVLDSVYNIDTPPTCVDQPTVPTDDVTFATLDPSAVTPTYSSDGKEITWTGIPASLTAAGAAAFGAGYPEGEALDPVTISVETE